MRSPLVPAAVLDPRPAACASNAAIQESAVCSVAPPPMRADRTAARRAMATRSGVDRRDMRRDDMSPCDSFIDAAATARLYRRGPGLGQLRGRHRHVPPSPCTHVFRPHGLLCLQVLPSRGRRSAAGTRLTASMTGAEEVPGPGDADGSPHGGHAAQQGEGRGLLRADGERDRASHRGARPRGTPRKSAGPVVVPLAAPTSGSVSACATGVNAELIKAIAKSPGDCSSTSTTPNSQREQFARSSRSKSFDVSPLSATTSAPVPDLRCRFGGRSVRADRGDIGSASRRR